MARIDTRRGAPQTYAPSPIPAPSSTPEERLRAIWDEFDRIAAYLAQLPAPVATTQQGAPDDPN